MQKQKNNSTEQADSTACDIYAFGGLAWIPGDMKIQQVGDLVKFDLKSPTTPTSHIWNMFP